MAAARDVDANQEVNQYPEHYTWNFLNGGADGGSSYVTGYEIIKVKENPYAFISDMAKGASSNYGIQSISLLAIKQ